MLYVYPDKFIVPVTYVDKLNDEYKKGKSNYEKKIILRCEEEEKDVVDITNQKSNDDISEMYDDIDDEYVCSELEN